jgi:chromosome segregation ATPase
MASIQEGDMAHNYSDDDDDDQRSEQIVRMDRRSNDRHVLDEVSKIRAELGRFTSRVESIAKDIEDLKKIDDKTTRNLDKRDTDHKEEVKELKTLISVDLGKLKDKLHEIDKTLMHIGVIQKEFEEVKKETKENTKSSLKNTIYITIIINIALFALPILQGLMKGGKS